MKLYNANVQYVQGYSTQVSHSGPPLFLLYMHLSWNHLGW